MTLKVLLTITVNIHSEKVDIIVGLLSFLRLQVLSHKVKITNMANLNDIKIVFGS